METKVEKSDPWLEDGSIVLSCERAARFRVHASLLARHSEVFRNLFADAAAQTASDDGATVEGCPVIELSDSVEDCQNLMVALYGTVTFKRRNVDDFLYVSSLLSMATKYCIDWLRNKAIVHLSRSWPHTLEGWMNLDKDELVHPSLVINLAHRTNVPIFLPLAYYRLGFMPMSQALQAQLNSSTGPIAQSVYCLSFQDVLNCVRYQEQRRLSARLFVHALHEFQPGVGCRQHTNDVSTIGTITSDVRRQFLDADLAPMSFMKLAKDCLRKFPLCRQCESRFIAVVDEKLQELWDTIPGWFGLPTWDVLKADFVSEEAL